jgi:hypothetical protein
MKRILSMIVLTIALSAFASTASATTAIAVASPTSLYTRLLTTKFSPMPNGYYSAKVGTDSLDGRDKKHHAIGRVLVTIDSDVGVSYGVYQSWQDARDRFNEKPKTPSGGKITLVGKVPGFHVQSSWINGSITGKNAFGKTVTNGISVMCARSDIVVVCAITTSVDNEESGDVPETIKLLRAGLTHLNAVRTKR